MNQATDTISLQIETFTDDKIAYVFEEKIFYNNEIWSRSNDFLKVLLEHGISLQKGLYH